MKKAKMHVSSDMLRVINGGVLCHRDRPRTVNTKERAIALWSCIQLRYIKTQEGFPLSLSLQQVPSKLNNVWIRYHNRQPMTCFSWTPTQAMLGISFFWKAQQQLRGRAIVSPRITIWRLEYLTVCLFASHLKIVHSYRGGLPKLDICSTLMVLAVEGIFIGPHLL